MWNGTVNIHMQLQVTRVTGAAQSRLNYLVYLKAYYLTAEAFSASIQHCPPCDVCDTHSHMRV